MTKVTTKPCDGCGVDIPANRKGCSKACRQRIRRAAGHRYYTGTCRVCGTQWPTNRADAVLCSDECRSRDYRGRQRPRPEKFEQPTLPLHSQPGPLNQAIRDGDPAAVVRALLARTERHGQCMVWAGAVDPSGYPRVHVHIQRRRWVPAHRVMAEAIHGPLEFRPVHHACANRLCLNPDHLQVVEPHENTAEMLERQHYLRRIAALEAALSTVAPGHPALAG